MPQLLYLWEEDLVTSVQEAGWAPGPVLTGAEDLAPTGIQPLDLPDNSKSLYWLHYLSPQISIQIYGKLPYLETPFPRYDG